MAHDFATMEAQEAVSVGAVVSAPKSKGFCQIQDGFHKCLTEEGGAAMSVTPYVRIPLAIFEARKSGSITAQQMNILACAYLWASRPEFRVAAYSAQRVCEFQGLATSRANLERYRRAAADLLVRNLIKRDYRKIDPRRNDQKERTYSIWVPAPARFVAVGTPEENQTRLWGGSLSMNTHRESGQTCNATPTTDASGSQSDVYTSVETRNASLSTHAMRIPYQENQKIETLPASQGEASPLPSPPGTRSNGAGLLETRKPLPSVAADKKNRIDAVALKYVEFCDWIYGFTPNVDHVAAILFDFSPSRLAVVQLLKFPAAGYRKKDMAYFFRHGAITLLRARQQNERAPGLMMSKIGFSVTFGRDWPEVRSRLDEMTAAWKRVSVSEDGSIEMKQESSEGSDSVAACGADISALPGPG